MRAIVQRVSSASVMVGKDLVGSIQSGLLVLLGVAVDDQVEDAIFMAEKIPKLRIFADNQEKMNLSIREIGGSILLVSQFTLYGDVSGGNRPGFERAAKPELAEALYDEVVKRIRATGLHVETGRFRTAMQVTLCNDGPVTLLVESKKQF